MKGEEGRNDAQLEAIFSTLAIKLPKLTSQCDKTITQMCVNSECEFNAFICNDPDCDKCGTEVHNCCLRIPLKGITKILQKRSAKQKDFISDICKIQNKLIESLCTSRTDLLCKFNLNIEEKYLKTYNQIYNEQTKTMKSSQVRQFYQRLMKTNKEQSEYGKILLKDYENWITRTIDCINDKKNRIISEMMKCQHRIRPELPIVDSNIIRKPLNDTFQEFKMYDSMIIKHNKSLIDELAREQTNFLSEILNGPKSIQLIYRGSQYNFSAASFHQKCDNTSNTLTLVRTEFGKTIGGFTQYTWNVVTNIRFREAGKHAFLFSLDMKEKMVPNNENNLIYCHTSFGPSFGNDDLHIVDQCHINATSVASFPSAYNAAGQKKYEQNQRTYRAFCGSPNKCNFKVLEYEVFIVNYE